MFEPNNFQKMRVKNSFCIMSNEVSSALKYFASLEPNKSSYLTTAWLVEQLAKWHKIMTSRSPKLSLSYHDIDKYNETVTFLYEAIDFQHLKQITQ